MLCTPFHWTMVRVSVECSNQEKYLTHRIYTGNELSIIESIGKKREPIYIKAVQEKFVKKIENKITIKIAVKLLLHTRFNQSFSFRKKSFSFIFFPRKLRVFHFI